MEILNKFNLAPPPSSPSKGGINKVFPPQEGGFKGEEFFVWDEPWVPPLGGGLRGMKVLYGASDAFPPLEGDKGAALSLPKWEWRLLLTRLIAPSP